MAFLSEFSVDPNVVMGELRALRTIDQDVNKFADEFMKRVQKLD